MNKRKILWSSLLVTTLLVITSGLLGQFGALEPTPVFASSRPDPSTSLFPLFHPPLGRSIGASSSYLHIYDGTWLAGCDLYIPGGTNLPDLSQFSRCGYGNWNDAISSFILGSGLWVQFYKNTNYSGGLLQYTGPVGIGVMPSGWDNSISSLKVNLIAAPQP